jgi:uncharacterized protein (TIGR02172 family)
MEKGPLIGAGRTADVFAWGGERILKLYQDWMPAVAVEREFIFTRACREAGLPVPAAEELLQVDGRLGIVFERIRGVSMLKILETRPWKFVSLSRLLAELHAKMHALRLPDGSMSQREQIERGIEWAKDLSEMEKAAVRDRLARLPDSDAICHGDFHPDNVLMTDRGPVIIDWMTGTRGHPLADVARTALLFQTGGLPPRIPAYMRLLINVTRASMYATYSNRYRHLRPARREQIDAWQLPLLAARLFEVENFPAEKEMILKRIRKILAGNRQGEERPG